MLVASLGIFHANDGSPLKRLLYAPNITLNRSQDLYSEEDQMKRMAICAIIRNKDNEFIIVEPTYRNDWLMPGGVIEQNESPKEACEREIKEELGVDIKITRMLCIEYQSAHSNKSESIQFIADGGVITEQSISQIQLQESEIRSYRFVNLHDSTSLLNPLLRERLDFAFSSLESGEIVYIEDKKLIVS
jgi:8-oxo-dGTP diphosphatase